MIRYEYPIINLMFHSIMRSSLHCNGYRMIRMYIIINNNMVHIITNLNDEWTWINDWIFISYHYCLRYWECLSVWYCVFARDCGLIFVWFKLIHRIVLNLIIDITVYFCKGSIMVQMALHVISNYPCTQFMTL